MKTKYFFVFIAQLFYPVSEDVRLNTTYFSIMKIPKRWELQQIIINYSCDTGFNQFKKIYRKTSKNYWRIGKREGGGGGQFVAIQSYFCYVSNKQNLCQIKRNCGNTKFHQTE